MKALLFLTCWVLVASAGAAVDVDVSGSARQGPVVADPNGRFIFPSVPLGKNAVNTFDVTAKDAAGNMQTQSISITQLSLDSIVVSKVTARPLPPEEIEQLVADGTIDLADPENYNVSVFTIVLTIDKEQVPVQVTIPRRKNEPVGEENLKIPTGRPSSGGSGRVPDAVIFEFQPPAVSPGMPLPPPIPGVILIEGRIKSLKEFFGVRLLLMNTSGIFTLSDVNAMISFPDGGLSTTLPMDGVAKFGDILPGTADAPGQAEREFIIRGDQIGTRGIQLDFGGKLTGPGITDPIPFNGAGTTSVEVKGPPTFQVQVSHPDMVTANVPYQLEVNITNTGETPALYASLDLDVGAAADIADCTVDPVTMIPDCTVIPGVVTRPFGHILPGAKVTEVFTVLPFQSGAISSCTAASDQNITLQVNVGNLGCLVGTFPPPNLSPDGSPSVTVIPTPNLFGVSIDAPVVAFFSELIDEPSVAGNFQVLDEFGVPVPSQITFSVLSGRTAAIWQVSDGVTNRLAGNTEYTVRIGTGVRDLEGKFLANDWESTFTTTDPNNDTTPPTLTLNFEPPADPLNVQPGEVLQLNAYPQDQGTRVARVEVRLLDVDDPNATQVFLDQKSVFDSSTLPCLFAIDTANLVPGHNYQVLARAFDNAGNFQNATLGFVLATAPILPSITLPADITAPAPQGISVQFSPLSVGPTVRNVAYFLDGAPTPFATGFLPPYQASVDTLNLAPGPHTVTAVASDTTGATAQDTIGFDVVVNNGIPTVSFPITDGAQYLQGLLLAINASVVDPLGLTSVEFFLDGVGGTPIATGTDPFIIDTAALALGAHTVTVRATNLLGNTNDINDPVSILQFSVLGQPVGGTAPPAPVITSVSLPRIGAGNNQVVQVVGTSAPGARIDLTNLQQGLTNTVFADAAGDWSATLGGDPGDIIQAIAFDLSQSSSPSLAANATVAAPPFLVSLQVTPTPLTFTAFGALQQMTVTGNFSDGSTPDVTDQVTYSVSTPGIVSVAPDGRVTSLANGTTDVVASLDGVTGLATVTVNVVTLTGITATPDPLNLGAIGASQTIAVLGQFSDGSSGPVSLPVSFFSSDPTVVQVDGAGLATAVSGGTATIFVSVGALVPVAISVDVGANDPAPTVQILAPPDGTDVEPGSLVGFMVEGSDLGGGVAQLIATATGEATFSQTLQIQPPLGTAPATFNVPIPLGANVGGQVQLSIQAVDTGGSSSAVASINVNITDLTRPQVTIASPAPDSLFNFGDAIQLQVDATDAVGVAEFRYDVTGAFTDSGSHIVSPTQTTASHTFQVAVPFGLTSPDVLITAQALDAQGNVGSAAVVPVRITNADITPPDTIVTGVGSPSGTQVTVDYTVQTGLSDLDHVELFFRRDGHGTFNRYTDAPGGNTNGEYQPQSGANGSIVFDSTRMGGDGDYEFATVGVDTAGNREPLPDDGSGNPIADPGATATIAVGTVFTLLDADTQVLGGVLDGQNVRIDGARVTFVGSHSLQNVELLNGAIVDPLPADATTSDQLDLTVWTLTIDATSSIDASGLGYLGGTATDEFGQTAGNQIGSGRRQGGSYGGLGGNGAGVADVPAPVYGDLTEPLLPGGGGGASGTTDGGNGGGLILLGAINVVVDGAIRADGAVGQPGRSGMGAGGGVNLRTRTLSGLGTIQADGGNLNGANNIGGGGGRVAVRFLDSSSYDPQLMTAAGGDGFYADGADGTIFLLQEGQPVGDLVINGNGPGSALTTLLIPPGASFDTIILQNGANVLAPSAIQLAADLVLRGGSMLTHATGNESCLLIDAARVDIDASSSIDVSGRGYAGGVNTVNGGAGETLAGQVGSSIRAGGSYGGAGGVDAGGTGAGLAYGDPKRPMYLGSGGGANSTTTGGEGGGCVRITASQEVIADGAIRANGGIGSSGRSGMGSGGSVWITTSRLAGDGVIQADGGDRNGANNNGGGGGRVALEVDYVDPQSDLGGLRQVTARGGDGFYTDGAPGTVFIHRTGDIEGELIVDAGLSTGTWPLASSWVPIGPGVAAAVGPDSLTTDGAVPLLPGGLVGLRLNPDLQQAETFEISANSDTTISVVSPNENGIGFASVASPGAFYAGTWIFDRVFLQGGAFVEIADPLIVNQSLDIVEASWLTHPQTTRTYEARLDLDVDTLLIDGTSRIDVGDRGYEGGRATGEPGLTLGNLPGSSTRVGGSYGGLGGQASGSGGPPNPVYGSLTDPQDLGSGGGANGTTDGGDGGGRVLIVATQVDLGGSIRADGGIGNAGQSGMGSGGTLNLDVGLISGAGTLSAIGGDLSGGNNVGGGGGRIAIQHAQPLGIATSQLRVRGGDGFYDDGGPGTIFLRSPSQLFGDLIIDGSGFNNPTDLAILPGNLTFDDIQIRDGAQVLALGPIQATGDVSLLGGSTLTHVAGDEGCLQISADNFTVEAGSAVDVTARGYPGGIASGEPGTTLSGQIGAGTRTGGGYGGLGGRDSGASGSIGSEYGEPRRPMLLGSGGGADGTTDGGAGGGCVRVVATSDVTVEGSILANGGIGASGRSGMGSGGSIWLTASNLSGDGEIRADGGDRNNGNNTGGGGGRIALDVGVLNPSSDFNGLRNVTVRGGKGFYADGAPGTVFVQRTGDIDGELIVDAGLSSGTWPVPARWVVVGPGVAAGVGADTLLTDGGVTYLPGALAGLRLNPDLSQSETFLIGANTASVLTVVTPNENGVDFATVASAGATYAGDYRFDQVTLRGGAYLEVGDPLTVSGALDVIESSWLSHPETTRSYEASLDVQATSILIDGTSQIEVTGRGYEGGKASGESGFTLGNVPGSGTRSGGSYGGLGGEGAGSGGPPNAVYGDALDPVDLGSGGGSNGTTDGGDGGGRVLLQATDLTLDGLIRANGDIAPSGRSGMGSGGSVNVVVDSILGIGSISADGGDKNGGDNSGGGGGRVSISNVQPRGIPAGNITAAGGDGLYADGLDGTVSLQGP